MAEKSLAQQIREAQNEGYAPNEILSFLVQNGNQQVRDALNEGHTPDDIVKYILSSDQPVTLKPILPSSKQIGDKLGIKPVNKETEMGFTGSRIAGDVAGGVLGGLLGGPPGALAGTAGVDAMIRASHGNPPGIQAPLIGQVADLPEGPISNIADIGTGMASDLAGGKVIEGLAGIPGQMYRGFMEYKFPGSIVPRSEGNLGLTYSQYKPEERTLAKFIENFMAPASKRSAILNTQTKIAQNLEQDIEQATGAKIDLTTPLEREAQTVQSEFSKNYYQSISESTAAGEGAKLIAKGNTYSFPVVVSPAKSTQVPSGVVDQFGNPVLKTVITPAVTKNISISGPIVPVETNDVIEKIFKDVQSGAIKPSAGDKLINVAKRLQDRYTAGQGNIPLGFDEAWELKKELGEYAASHYQNKTDFLGDQYKQLTKALNTDIETSMAQWRNGPQQALDLWKQSKAIVAAREDAFTNKINKIRFDKSQDLYPQINRMIDDSKQLQKALNAGDIDILTKSPAGSIVSLAATNTRQTLRDYQMKRLLMNAWDVNTETGAKVFNPEKLLQSWNKFAATDSGQILFNKAARDSATEVLSNFAKHSSQNLPGRSYLWIRGATGTIGLGAGIISEMMGSGPITKFTGPAGIAISGGIIGGNLLGRLLNNPNAARVLEAMSRGGPLGMSQKMASRIIAQALTGEDITLILSNGTKVDGKIDKKGNFDAGLSGIGNLGKDIKVTPLPANQ